MKLQLSSAAVLLSLSLFAAEPENATKPAPTADRVGFPKDYAKTFEVLRVVNKSKEHKVVTVYGNPPAGSVTNRSQLPYPYGSVIVMETAQAREDAAGNSTLDSKGNVLKGAVTGLHVMRREPGFGAAYKENRAGEWEYVEYKPDGSHITPPQKSASCAECHMKAGASRDFVYQARLTEQPAH